MEDYAAKMARKTDAELRVYLAQRSEYRADAVLAAAAELDRRGYPQIALLPELEEAARLEAAAEAAREPVPAPWAREQATEAADEEENVQGPALYTPGTIAIFSVVFSFFAGGILMLINMVKLRRFGGAALLTVVITALELLQIWAIFAKLVPQYITWPLNLGAAIFYSYYLWPRLVKDQPYQRRSWVPPLLILFGVAMVLAWLAVRLGLVPPGMN